MTVFWRDNRVWLLDQNALPLEERYVSFTNWRDVAHAIRIMTVRGAPAIGVTAAFGLALAAAGFSDAGYDDAFAGACREFSATRPTAVNLFWAVNRMRSVSDSTRLGARRGALLAEAQRIRDEDEAMCRAIGRNGAALLNDGDTVLTHCNAGALATADYGTALGVIRAAVQDGKRIKVFADETRPRLQGLRLTAWELMRDGIDVTVIPDNASGSLMRAGVISAVVVGSDRIAANGEVANKIGTYNVAVLARHHGIPFYVAAPFSTVDASVPSGGNIPIEERAAEEVTEIAGVRLGPAGVKVYNPAFDVTPADLVTAIITERGVYYPPYDF
jgi:methylthioribose-1-phosphate isomerase